MAEKSEAQRRNENEVRRIMEQRGYDTAAHKKQQKNIFRDHLVIPKIIIGILLIGGVACGVFFVFSNIENSKNSGDLHTDKDASKDISNDMTAGTDADNGSFFQCYDAIEEKNIDINDAAFWDKTISYYKAIINCYDMYPDSAVSFGSKEKIEQDLANAIEKKEKEQNGSYGSSNYTYSTANTETANNCNHEYDSWLTLDKEARQAYKEAEAASDQFTNEYLHEKCDNAADSIACSRSLQEEVQQKLTKAQTAVEQARVARQTYDSCMGN